MVSKILRPKNPYLRNGETKPKIKIRWGILGFWLIVILAGVYFFRYSNFFNIAEIIIEGGKVIKDDEILVIAEKYKEENDNLFKYPVKEVEKEILEKFLQIKAVSVSRGVPRTIKIEISEREGFLVWQTKSINYLVDASGVAFRKTQDVFSLPQIIDNKDRDINFGEKFLDKRFLKFISDLNKNFTKNTKLKIKKITIEDSTFELNLELTTGWKIKFDTTRSADNQIAALSKVLPHIKNKVKEYIDLRTENRVYYK